MQANTQLMPVKPSALTAMASRFNMDPNTLMNTLKNTVFKGATNEQLAALVIVANEHGLNPFTREIYAFPDKSGGIQAVIGVDGWIRIITTNPAFDGVEFTIDPDENSCTCTMHVKGRAHPVKVTEYFEECKRNTEPWRTYPRRMLRHKALIQAGRVAFGLGSLKDEDDVMVAPASVTVSRPIFGHLSADNQPDAPSDQDGQTYPMPAEPAEPEKDDSDLGPQKPAVHAPTQNYPKAVKALLKLSGHKESELLDLLHSQGMDDSLTSIEEVAIAAAPALKLVHDEWSNYDGQLKKLKGKK